MQENISKIRFNVGSILMVIFILSLMIPYLAYIGRGYVLPFCIFFIWLIVILSKQLNARILIKILALRKLEILLLILFLLVTTFYYLFITPTAKAFQFLLMPIMYLFLLFMDCYYSGIKTQYRLTILFFIITALGIQAAVSLPYILSAENLVARLYTSGGLEGKYLEEAVRNGVGGTALYTTLTGIFFLGVGSIKRFKSKSIKLIIAFSLFFIILSIIASSFSLPIVLLSIGFLILISKIKLKQIRGFYFILAGFVIFGMYYFYTNYLSGSELMEPIYNKIEVLEKGDLKQDGRSDLAYISIESFKSFPFWGVGVPEWGTYKQVGEHMPWIDFFAHYGFLGFLPYILFLIVLFRKNIPFYFYKGKYDFYSWSCFIGFSIFIISNFVNPLIFEAPMVIMLIFYYTSMSNWTKLKPRIAN